MVMPTAMVSMHEDEEQSASSARTAQRGRRILQAFKTNAQVEENVKAILSVANGGDDSDQDASLIKVRACRLVGIHVGFSLNCCYSLVANVQSIGLSSSRNGATKSLSELIYPKPCKKYSNNVDRKSYLILEISPRTRYANLLPLRMFRLCG